MKRILIISASAGSGHTTAARAIEQWIPSVQRYPGEFQVTHIDILQFSTMLYKKVYRDVYLYLASKQPLLYGYIFSTSDRLRREKKPEFLMRFMDSINAIKFTEFIKETPWDVIVSTHFLPSQLIADLKQRKKVFSPLVTITTDFGLHSYWIISECDHYIVADSANQQHLTAMGIPAERIHELGIPVLPVFTQRKDRPELKKELGLTPALPAILLLSGGFGISPIEHIVSDLVRMKNKFQLVAITGHNRKMLQKLRSRSSSLPYHLRTVGYTDRMDEYMRVCDLVISKPGGLTVAESLTMGLPMIVINPIPGQEDMNSDMLLESGAGVKAMHPVDVTYKLEMVMSTPGRLQQMKKAAKKIAKPKAGYMAADFIARLAREQSF
jgi:processive 1,2-diacylglycerol beta-glucosyltransferase